MRKIVALTLAALALTTPVMAYEGEIGYFGGITPGDKLPKSTVLAAQGDKKPSRVTLPYKETLYLSGKAVTVEGTLEIRPQVLDKEKGAGKYSETYVVKAENKDANSKVTRTLTLDTSYVYDDVQKQTTKTSEVKKWTEIVVAEGQTYQIDAGKSSFSKSIVEDYTPGVTYYRGDVSYEAVYRPVSGGGDKFVVMRVDGPVYGYEHAYSKTETQRRNIYIENGGNTYYIEETPTYTTNKDLQYGANEPGAISFAGNYKEVLSGKGTVMYDIKAGHPGLYEDELRGSVGINDVPSFEQLQAYDLVHLKGHPAESDVRKMYSMKIFTDSPSSFSPNQVVTRGEYIKMLVRALKIELPKEEKKKGVGKDKEEEVIIFTDIKKEDPLYPYAMAAYNSGLINGGKLNPGVYLTREEMLAMNVRAIGLQRLGIATGGMYTPFIDDARISSWAKASVYAASRIGLVEGSNGYLFPDKKVTYAEVAAFMNRMLDYLRYDLEKDYNEKMMM
ncbi:MAG: S-layer homology domain-containing protein [Cellulosilyticaceae bacterium]